MFLYDFSPNFQLLIGEYGLLLFVLPGEEFVQNLMNDVSGLILHLFYYDIINTI